MSYTTVLPKQRMVLNWLIQGTSIAQKQKTFSKSRNIVRFVLAGYPPDMVRISRTANRRQQRIVEAKTDDETPNRDDYKQLRSPSTTEVADLDNKILDATLPNRIHAYSRGKLLRSNMPHCEAKKTDLININNPLKITPIRQEATSFFQSLTKATKTTLNDVPKKNPK